MTGYISEVRKIVGHMASTSLYKGAEKMHYLIVLNETRSMALFILLTTLTAIMTILKMSKPVEFIKTGTK